MTHPMQQTPFVQQVIAEIGDRLRQRWHRDLDDLQTDADCEGCSGGSSTREVIDAYLATQPPHVRAQFFRDGGREALQFFLHFLGEETDWICATPGVH